ncbi:MAG TPA: transposase, partial [Anaerovoracaceae bacterium]|nr:transposase [Anaerovoracaceae bacterium]
MYKSNRGQTSLFALGAHIIREKYGISDVETVEHIEESPYLQWFIGMTEFRNKAPFDAGSMTWFRKRLTPEMIAEVNDYVTGRKKIGQDDHGRDNHGSGEGSKEAGSEETTKSNQETLIVDATCTPADIKFSTDVTLLNEARENLEEIITGLHEKAGEEEKKPRSYKRRARKEYLRFARNRKPGLKAIRKAVRQQL